MPKALLDACDDLRREWKMAALSNAHVASALQRRIQSEQKISAVVTLVCPSTVGLGEPTFVIELHPQHGDRERSVRSDRTLAQLTATEREVALVLAEGLSNQEIADRLGKSIPAVKFLLHRIY